MRLDPVHIEGLHAGEVRSDVLAGVPLISMVDDGLWMGGCIGDCELPDEIGFVLSLYPWEHYRLKPGVERLEMRLYDSAEVPNPRLIDGLAEIVNHKLAELDERAIEQRRAELPLKRHQVLVHCQAGLNRSGLIVARSLMLRTGCTAASAISRLRAARDPYVLCNDSFTNWLRGFDG